MKGTGFKNMKESNELLKIYFANKYYIWDVCIMGLVFLEASVYLMTFYDHFIIKVFGFLCIFPVCLKLYVKITKFI